MSLCYRNDIDSIKKIKQEYLVDFTKNQIYSLSGDSLLSIAIKKHFNSLFYFLVDENAYLNNYNDEDYREIAEESKNYEVLEYINIQIDIELGSNIFTRLRHINLSHYKDLLHMLIYYKQNNITITAYNNFNSTINMYISLITKSNVKFKCDHRDTHIVNFNRIGFYKRKTQTLDGLDSTTVYFPERNLITIKPKVFKQLRLFFDNIRFPRVIFNIILSYFS